MTRALGTARKSARPHFHRGWHRPVVSKPASVQVRAGGFPRGRECHRRQTPVPPYARPCPALALASLALLTLAFALALAFRPRPRPCHRPWAHARRSSRSLRFRISPLLFSPPLPRVPPSFLPPSPPSFLSRPLQRSTRAPSISANIMRWRYSTGLGTFFLHHRPFPSSLPLPSHILAAAVATTVIAAALSHPPSIPALARILTPIALTLALTHAHVIIYAVTLVLAILSCHSHLPSRLLPAAPPVWAALPGRDSFAPARL